MTSEIDGEIQAIKTLLTALEPLDQKVRGSVLDYVMRRLGIAAPQVAPSLPITTPSLPPGETQRSPGQVHIRDLVRQKQPRNAVEMATIVAYFLSHVASAANRKDTVNTKDIETYFKIGEFKLPTKPRFTLPNSKQAGYLDSVGGGEYKLNPVGYNLVVHSMPRAGKAQVGNRSLRKRKTRSRQGKRQK